MLSGPVLILKSFSFYSDTVANILKSQLQGLAHVFDWRKDAKGNPESFYKNLWEKSKDRYLAVVVLGEEVLNFAIKNIREKPVIFIYSYHTLDTLSLPENFTGIFGTISPSLHLEKFLCAFEENRGVGIILHKSEWESLKDLFASSINIGGKNPLNEIYLKFVENPLQIQSAFKDMVDFGIKLVWIPPTSILNFGRYKEEISSNSKKFNLAVSSYDVSDVRTWSIYSWRPNPSDFPPLILENLLSIEKSIKEIGNPKIQRLKYQYIYSASAGNPTLNKTLASKLKLKVSNACVFKEVY
jgi:hypothetical protein